LTLGNAPPSTSAPAEASVQADFFGDGFIVFPR
jgi:hypothetical protein